MNVEYEKLAADLKSMRQAGVPSDGRNRYRQRLHFPGVDLHRELELLVEAGLTPLEALRSATLEPAKFLGTKDLGAIAPGNWRIWCCWTPIL